MPPSRDDRKAALGLVLLTAVGVVVRLVLGAGGPPGSIRMETGGPSLRPNKDSVATQSARIAQPLRRGEKIDVDKAGVDDLTRLPRIGPALALRIVESRRSEGPFGGLDGLGRVSGIGPRVLENLAPHVVFSGTVRPRVVPRPSRGRPGLTKLSINEATEAELTGLPGIGPTRAAAIIEHRRLNGPYRTIEDLLGVPGIGVATVNRLRDRVRVP